MRLFIAIDLPDEIKKYLCGVQAGLARATNNSADLVLAHDFHMTLKFLGECGANKLPEIELELESVKFEKIECSLKKVGTFGGGRDGTGKPSVAWIGIKMSREARGLVTEIEKRMFRLGFKKDIGFVPHVTLAQIKDVKNSDVFLGVLNKMKIEPREFSVSSFCLFESKFSAKGVEHIILKKFP